MEYQVARMTYQFNKLGLIRTGAIREDQGGNVEFELYAFFEACYHLKDWIRDDRNLRPHMSAEQFVKVKQPLMACADIYHRVRQRELGGAETATLGQFHVARVIDDEVEGQAVRILEARIYTALGDLCCFQLAKDCIDAWACYFRDNGIESSLLPFAEALAAESS